MSTPAKVLVVLLLLITPIWILMIASTAQLNKNWGEQLKKYQDEIEPLTNQVVDLKRSVVNLRDQIALEQMAMSEHLAVIRAHKADLEKSRSKTIEVATRVKYQVAAYLDAAKRAEVTKELRGTERTKEIEAKNAVEAEVEHLKQDHAQLVEQLDKLRGQFKATVDSNRKLVNRLKAKKAS